MTFFAAMTICSIAAVTDIRGRRIPNWLTYSAMLLGIGYNTIIGGMQGFLFGAGGLSLGLALLIFFYLAGGMGAGDVKLMGAVGALLGPTDVFIVSIFTALVGGIYAVVLLLVRFRVKGTATRLSTMFYSLMLRTGLPARAVDNNGKITVLNYGVAIAIGVFLCTIWKLYG